MSELDLALSIALGIGLAAATGFRVFLPLLVMSIAAQAGYLPLGENFAWLASTSALTMLAIAAFLEVLAYYIPGVDNLLDTPPVWTGRRTSADLSPSTGSGTTEAGFYDILGRTFYVGASLTF